MMKTDSKIHMYSHVHRDEHFAFCHLFFFPSIRFSQPIHIIMLNSLLSSLLKVYCKSDIMHMCTSAYDVQLYCS